MASAHQPPHSYSHPPPPGPRLPSLKDLNFPYRPPPSQDGQAQSNGLGQNEHSRPSRHDSASWGRSNGSLGPNGSVQHQTNMAPPESPKSHPYNNQKNDAAYMTPMPPQGAPGMNGVGGSGSGSSRGDPPQPSGKRPRSSSIVNSSPGRAHVSNVSPSTYSQHMPYSSQPPPPPPQSYQQGPPVSVPSPHESAHQPPYSHQPPYGQYPPPHMSQRHYPAPPPPQPQPAPVHQQSPPTHSYPPPLPPDHWQQHPPQPPPQQAHQYAGFPRTTALVPASVETRSSVATPVESEKVNARQGTISEIVRHCNVLYSFATRYAQLQANIPNAQPSQPELQEMSHHANTVVRLLEDLRRLSELGESVPKEAVPVFNMPEEHTRPPKRPWEDMSREEDSPVAANYVDQYNQPPDNQQSTAEQDMEIIRSKRATSAGGNAPGQPKSKYRKRSRATPPGKCHSCNIRETPEWRRGPDGARTLCNACGLHYAKLMRKRDKLGADGRPAPIDMQTLRASTASARGAEGGEPVHAQPQSQPHHGSPLMPPPPPYEQQKQHAPPPPPPPGHHASHTSQHSHAATPYQLMPVGSGPSSAGSAPPHQMMPPPPPPATHHEAGGVPPPPWMTSSSSSSRSGYNSDHQSYMRSSHTPSHARGSPQ